MKARQMLPAKPSGNSLATAMWWKRGMSRIRVCASYDARKVGDLRHSYIDADSGGLHHDWRPDGAGAGETKDIQVLKAMGANRGLIQKIFLGEGLLLAGIGAIAGIVLAVVFCWAQVQFETDQAGGRRVPYQLLSC